MHIRSYLIVQFRWWIEYWQTALHNMLMILERQSSGGHRSRRSSPISTPLSYIMLSLRLSILSSTLTSLTTWGRRMRNSTSKQQVSGHRPTPNSQKAEKESTSTTSGKEDLQKNYQESTNQESKSKSSLGILLSEGSSVSQTGLRLAYLLQVYQRRIRNE